MSNPSLSIQDVRIEATNFFLRKVYHWMAIGLILTAIMAHYVASNESMLGLVYGSHGVFFGLFLAQVLLVMGLSWGLNRISAVVATGMFIFYSLLNGVTLSGILLIYTGESVFSAFLTTAGMFGVMSVYGLFTKRDLTSWRSFLIMGLGGLIIAGLVNIFTKSSAADLVISGIGVLVFLGLTAYDTQYLRNLGSEIDAENGSELSRKFVIIGALKLYLDFVNLFLYLLRFMGRRR